MAKTRHSRRTRRHRRSKLLGGDSGATQHAIDTYGGIGQQHAVSANNHTIAMKHSGGGLPALAPSQVGGQPLSPGQYNGGGIIADIAVPATIIYTRNVIKNRRFPGSSSRKSRRHSKRKGRR
jgi:hypothetical protein